MEIFNVELLYSKNKRIHLFSTSFFLPVIIIIIFCFVCIPVHKLNKYLNNNSKFCLVLQLYWVVSGMN